MLSPKRFIYYSNEKINMKEIFLNKKCIYECYISICILRREIPRYIKVNSIFL